MIQLDGIHHTYRGGNGPVHALRGVDLQVQRGEVFGVIGRSGAGKSSLVRTINLLNRPDQGRVWVDGQDLTTLDAAGLRRARHGIGMVFQHFNLLSSRTVFDNVALPLELAGLSRREIRERVQPLLELVGLGTLGERYPAQISGGQKQRVAIARALAGDPLVRELYLGRAASLPAAVAAESAVRTDRPGPAAQHDRHAWRSRARWPA